MGMIGVYVMIDTEILEKLKQLDADSLPDAVNDLEENHETFVIDKLWDGLHRLLTGASASTPIDGDPLSDAVVGSHLFDTTEDDYMSWTEQHEIPGIAKALESANIEELNKKFDPNAFAKEKIYPDIWNEHGRDELFKELIDSRAGLLDFYNKAMRQNMHVVFSVL